MKPYLYFGLDPTRSSLKLPYQHVPLIVTKRRSQEELAPFFSHLLKSSLFLCTSCETVKYVKELCEELFHSLEPLRKILAISVGKATERALYKLGLDHVLTAKEETGEGLCALLDHMTLVGASIFYPHSLKARPLLSQYLQSRTEMKVCDFVLYEPQSLKPPELNLTEYAGGIFTSPSVVRAAWEAFKESYPSEFVFYAKGPVTKKAFNSFYPKKNITIF